MDISIIVPVFNEIESLRDLSIWISNVMRGKGLTYEVIMIDDGSTDGSWNEIEILSKKNYNIKGARFRRNYGKSAALNKGFELCKGDVVITMDADLQDSPEEIPELYRLIEEEKYDIVSGWKKKRHDPLNKRIPSKLYNMVVRRFTGIKLHDFNCGLKAYRQDVVKSIEVFGEMHRYIPVIAKAAGFKKITEKVVSHQSRKFGTSKYGAERYIKGFLDLVTITFMAKYVKRPMHFFGLLGTLMFLIGFGIMIYFTIGKFVYDMYNMTERPLFFFGVVTMILGTQLFVGGFLAEMISRSGEDRNNYLVSHTTGFSKRPQQNQNRQRKANPRNQKSAADTNKKEENSNTTNKRVAPRRKPANNSKNNNNNNKDITNQSENKNGENNEVRKPKPQNRQQYRRPKAKQVEKQQNDIQQPESSQ